MKVCVVGGAGFVGSHVVDSLVYANHEPIVVDNFFTGKPKNIQENVKIYNEDACQLTVLQEIIESNKTDVVINLAMKCLPTSFVDPEGAYMVGVQIAHNLAYLLRKKIYNKLIHFSSSEVYGTAQYVPMDEKHPTNPTTPYGAGKLAADHLLLSYCNLFSLDISIVRPFNLIGPRQNWALYAAVVPITIRRILKGDKAVVEWDGQQTRDFTYVKDVTDIIPKLLTSDALKGKAVNFGSGKETRILDLINVICSELDCQSMKYAPKRRGDVRRHCADISLAQKLVGYKPKTPLKDAVHLTVEWFKKNLK